MSEVIARFKNFSYKYPSSGEMILKDINLEIRKGEFLGVIGPTGAGKTTLSHTLNGIVPQFYGGDCYGSLLVNGFDTLEHPISLLSQHVGAVFEDPESQITSNSVENEIAFALENLKVPREEIIKRIPESLKAVRLSGMEKKHPHELSGGQKQRLAIAAALALRPQIMVLDEPTSQLDPIGTREVFSTVRELNRDRGITVVVISHAAEEMAEYSDRVLLLVGGEVKKIGTPEEIYGDSALLKKHTLRCPEVAQVFHELRDQDIPVDEIPVKMNEGFQTMGTLIDRHKHCGKELDFQKEATRNQEKKAEPLIRVEGMRHVYPDGTEALSNIDLTVNKGEYLLIIGQNGAGKSTLVKHFLKLLEPTEGHVIVGGQDTKNLSMSDLARNIGYVAQNSDNQIFNTSVEGEVSFALKNLKYDREEIEARTVDSLRALGLLQHRKKHPLSLPKGDRARVVIAAILAMKPDTVIFDEPTTGQDYQGSKYILDISKDLHEMGKTVIVITHHLYLMPEYAQRVVIMGKGGILMDSGIREAYNAFDVLEQTYLNPPQAVEISRSFQGENGASIPKLLSAKEVAEYFLAGIPG